MLWIRRAIMSAGLCLGVLALAGCGMSSSSSSSTSSAAATGTGTTSGTAAPAVLSVAQNSSLHHAILVNTKGMTVYYLTGETASHLLCTSKACLKFWPPVDLPSGATTPAAIKGVAMSKLGTVKRDGKLQVTYNGWPLYTFAGDTAAGQDKGENIKSDGGTWLVIQSPASASTTSTTAPPASSGGSSSSGGGWS